MSTVSLSFKRTPFQGFQQFWSLCKQLSRLCKGVPCSRSLVLFGPVGFLLGNGGLEELVTGLWRGFRHGICWSKVCYWSKVFLDLANYATFFPGLSACGHGCGCFIK